MVARLTPRTGHGKAYGGYGAWKGLGYTLGPVLGGVLITLGGYALLFGTLGGLALAVAAWALLAVPAVPPLPRARQTVLDLVRRLSTSGFVRPTLALGGATGALAVGVGFLPVAGAASGLGPLVTGAAVSVLAATAALVQPRAGRARDNGRISDGPGMAVGLALAAAGMTGGALLPGVAGLLVAAVLVGVGTGLATPIAFAHLAASTPAERLGQTMGAAEVGREVGDAGGPLMVGAIAAAAGALGAGLIGLAVALAALAVAVARADTRAPGS
jgi:MFS family permease